MAGESEYREALYAAQRALMHAEKNMTADDWGDVFHLVHEALVKVNYVLDIGRDESNEQVAT